MENDVDWGDGPEAAHAAGVPGQKIVVRPEEVSTFFKALAAYSIVSLKLSAICARAVEVLGKEHKSSPKKAECERLKAIFTLVGEKVGTPADNILFADILLSCGFTLNIAERLMLSVKLSEIDDTARAKQLFSAIASEVA